MIYKTVFPLIRRLEDEAKKRGYIVIETSIKNDGSFNFSCIKNGVPIYVFIRPMDALCKTTMSFLEKFVTYGNTAVVCLLTGKHLYANVVRNLEQLDDVWLYSKDFQSGNEVDPLQLLSSEDGLARIFSAGEKE